MISTIVFLFFLFLTYAVFLLATRKADAREARLKQRVAEALQESVAPQGERVKFLRESLISRNPRLQQLLGPLDIVRNMERMIEQADVQITVSRLLTFCLIAGVAAALAAYTLLSSLFAILTIGLVAALAPVFYIARKRQKRLRKFLEYMPDTLDLMSRALAVGHAFSETLYQVSEEMPEPVSAEFRITFEEQKLGLPLKLALDRLTERVPLLDLRLCVTAILIQRETGGNLSEILEKVSHTIRERFRVMEDFRTMTTNARGSAWTLCALPFVIVFVMTAMNPDYMSNLLQDPRGHYVLFAAAVLQLLGIFFIRRILKIRI